MPAKLKAFIPNLEAVDEALRDFYVEDTDGEGKKRFRLDADGVEDVGGLKATITALRKEIRDEYKPKVKLLEGVEEGEDVEAIITAGRAEVERQKSGKERDDVTSMKRQMTTAHGKEVEKLNNTIAAMRTTLEEELIDNRAVAEIADAKGNKTLLLPHIRGTARVEEFEDEEGKLKFAARVLGPDKKVRVDGKGNPIGIGALVAELRENPEFAGAFEGSGMSGSGTPPEGGSGTPTPPRTPSSKAPLVDSKRRTEDYAQI